MITKPTVLTAALLLSNLLSSAVAGASNITHEQLLLKKRGDYLEVVDSVLVRPELIKRIEGKIVLRYTREWVRGKEQGSEEFALSEAGIEAMREFRDRYRASSEISNYWATLEILIDDHAFVISTTRDPQKIHKQFPDAVRTAQTQLNLLIQATSRKRG